MLVELPQRLAAVLAADVAGYTRLMELDEARTVSAWRRARAQVIDPTITRFNGRIVKLTGDGFLAEFSTVESAVRAALTMQQRLSAMFAGEPSERRFAFRMGVNVGDIWVDAEDVYGAGVNVAARLEALAPPGGLCISDAVHSAIGHKIPARFEDLGPRHVKNVANAVHVWRLGETPRMPARRRALLWLARLSPAVAALLAISLVLQNVRTPPPTASVQSYSTGGAVARPAAVRVPGDAPLDAPLEEGSIAVLPFVNIDGSQEMRIFSDGLVEDIIGRLAAVPPLRVSSRGDSFALGSDSSSEEVRARLRVAYYVEGSVRKYDDTLRVVIQLIDSATGFQVVSRTFDRAIGRFTELQDEITNLIVASLRVALPPLADAPVNVTDETASFDAYLAYRRGMEILHRPMVRASIDEALAAFGVSLSVDPDYAAAFAGICLTYTAAYDVTSETDYVERAESSCGSALQRSPNLVVVHNALGELYLRTGRYAEAERAFERALAVDGKDVPALTGIASAYLSQQRPAEAERFYRRAVGLQPGNWRTYNSLGNFLYANGRYAEAAEAYREVVAVDTSNVTGWANLASSLMLTGDFASAAHAFERAGRLQPRPSTLMNLGMMHYYLGDADKARATLESAIEMAPQNYLAWSNLGDVLALSGDPAAARNAFIEAERLARGQLALNSRDASLSIDLAWITAMLGRADDAQRLIERALVLAPSDPYVHYYDALVRARAGEIEPALDRLETAVELGFSRAMIRAEPHLASLRDQERFSRLVGIGDGLATLDPRGAAP